MQKSPPESTAPAGAARCSCCANRVVVAVHCSGAVENLQSFGQLSQLNVLPSSQSSPAVTIPLPQRVTVQFASQPSPEMRLPSSHSSGGSTM